MRKYLTKFHKSSLSEKREGGGGGGGLSNLVKTVTFCRNNKTTEDGLDIDI